MSAGTPARSHLHFSVPACCASASFGTNCYQSKQFLAFYETCASCSRIMFYKMLFDRFVGFAYLYTVLEGAGKNGPGKNGPGKNGPGKNGPEKTVR